MCRTWSLPSLLPRTSIASRPWMIVRTRLRKGVWNSRSCTSSFLPKSIKYSPWSGQVKTIWVLISSWKRARHSSSVRASSTASLLAFTTLPSTINLDLMPCLSAHAQPSRGHRLRMQSFSRSGARRGPSQALFSTTHLITAGIFSAPRRSSCLVGTFASRLWHDGFVGTLLRRVSWSWKHRARCRQGRGKQWPGSMSLHPGFALLGQMQKQRRRWYRCGVFWTAWTKLNGEGGLGWRTPSWIMRKELLQYLNNCFGSATQPSMRRFSFWM